MTDLAEQLARVRAVVMLPDEPFAQTVAPVEVLVQESFTLLALPVDGRSQLGQLRPLFASRALLGVHSVATLAQAQAAIEQQAAFVFTQVVDAELTGTLQDAGIPVFLPGLTPLEIRAATTWQPDGVCLEPAGVLGAAYPEACRQLFPELSLLPVRAETDDLVRAWLDNKATAICVGNRLLANVFGSSGLALLRERCVEFGKVLEPYREH